MEPKIDDGWKSRKFWSALGSAAVLEVYSGVALALDWMSEATFKYSVTIALGAIAVYCGYNIVEKLGGIGPLLGRKE